MKESPGVMVKVLNWRLELSEFDYIDQEKNVHAKSKFYISFRAELKS